MKKNLKGILSVVMCLVLIASIFVGVPFTKAEAAGPEIAWAAASAMEFVVFVLGMLGISFASKAAMAQSANQYLSDNQQINQGLNDLIGSAKATINGTMKLTIGAEIFLYMKNVVIPSVSKYFSRSTDAIMVQDYSQMMFSGVKVTNINSFTTPKNYYDAAPYGASSTFTLKLNGIAYKYKFVERPEIYGYDIFVNDNCCSNINGSPLRLDNYLTYNNYNATYRWGIYYFVSGTTKMLVPYIAQQLISKATGAVEYKYMLGQKAAPTAFTISNVEYSSIESNYDYVIDYSLQELLAALQQKIDTMTGDLTIPWNGPAEDVEEGKEETTNPEDGKVVPFDPAWALWWQLLGIKDMMKTVTQSLSKTETDIKTPEMPVDIKNKFPFCVPFDLIALVTALNAPAVVPSATIPIKFSALGYESSMTINLAQFEGVAKAVRWGMTILYLFGLTVLTRKLIKG